MISFITVSQDVEKVNKLSINLHTAFPGARLELIHKDGACGSIFAGYNAGAAEAKHDFYAFLHDDVELLCHGGLMERPMELMRKPLTGFVGCAGTRVLSEEACWWKAPHEQLRGMAAHPGDNEFKIHWNVWPWQAALFGPVATLDGVFLMCHKRTFQRVGGFDEKTFTGFHFYDVDITFAATLKGLTNYAAPIPLLHQSKGVPNAEWEKNRQLFQKKYAGKLPYAMKE